jgi:hypothetical protein
MVQSDSSKKSFISTGDDPHTKYLWLLKKWHKKVLCVVRFSVNVYGTLIVNQFILYGQNNSVIWIWYWRGCLQPNCVTNLLFMWMNCLLLIPNDRFWGIQSMPIDEVTISGLTTTVKIFCTTPNSKWITVMNRLHIFGASAWQSGDHGAPAIHLKHLMWRL